MRARAAVRNRERVVQLRESCEGGDNCKESCERRSEERIRIKGEKTMKKQWIGISAAVILAAGCVLGGCGASGKADAPAAAARQESGGKAGAAETKADGQEQDQGDGAGQADSSGSSGKEAGPGDTQADPAGDPDAAVTADAADPAGAADTADAAETAGTAETAGAAGTQEEASAAGEDAAQETLPPAPESQYPTLQVVNCNESITLRTSPSTSASEICQIPLGDTVSYVSTETNGFYQIIYNGQTGYSLASYLAEVGEETDASYQFLTSQKYTYTQMESDLQQLLSSYSDYLTMDSLAQTADGRQLYHVIVGPKTASRHVLVFGSIHAREYMTTQLVMRQMERLLAQYRDNTLYQDMGMRDILADTAVHFIPMTNPDGVTISQLGLDGVNLPETRERLEQIRAMDGSSDPASYYRVWKSNAMGVDLNRNFDAKWDLYNDHVGHPSADHYKSTAIETEVESKALVELTKAYPFVRTISYHTQGGVIYWYFEQSGELRDVNLELAEMVSEETGYWIDSDYTKLDPAGYKDWAISKMGIPSLTIEVGTGSSPVDPAQFEGVWAQNKNVCQRVLYSLVK